MLGVGDFFNILGSVGGVSLNEVLEGLEVRVRVIEVMDGVIVGVVTLF
jgi:hypothetical protein